MIFNYVKRTFYRHFKICHTFVTHNNNKKEEERQWRKKQKTSEWAVKVIINDKYTTTLSKNHIHRLYKYIYKPNLLYSYLPEFIMLIAVIIIIVLSCSHSPLLRIIKMYSYGLCISHHVMSTWYVWRYRYLFKLDQSASQKCSLRELTNRKSIVPSDFCYLLVQFWICRRSSQSTPCFFDRKYINATAQFVALATIYLLYCAIHNTQ